RIWKWKGPNKVLHFLWLASHKRLLTNEERGRRHLTNQVNCPRCAAAVESFEHVIFGCNFASQVWRQAQCQFWTNLVLSSWKTFQLGREAPGLARQTQLIAWRPGEEGWFTLNTDGSRISQSGATAIGGIIRDSAGALVRAFSANVGNCSITRAELRAIVEGLKLAWSLGIRKVAIQSDLTAAVAMLQASGSPTHRHAALVAEFQAIRARQWDVSIAHIFREANCCADFLANLGHSLWFGFHVFDYPVSLLSDWLRYDLVGVALPRVVSCNN
ncbi:Putative ribonuclease H protein At1g65750, partial [Linum perenne]